MASVAAVVGNNLDNGNNGCGIDGSGDDGGFGDRKWDGGSNGNGNSNGSGKAVKTMVATALAVGENTTMN